MMKKPTVLITRIPDALKGSAFQRFALQSKCCALGGSGERFRRECSFRSRLKFNPQGKLNAGG